MMSIEEEDDASLKELVTKTLHNNGVLGKIQAQLRASVFLALEEEFKDKNIPLVSPSTQQVLGTPEGALAASLVQDFLQCLGLDFSLAVFSPESGHSSFWSFPGADSLSSSIGLTNTTSAKGTNTNDNDKGMKTPLLIELLRERKINLPLLNQQNGDGTSTSSNSSSSSNREQQTQQERNGLESTADTAVGKVDRPEKGLIYNDKTKIEAEDDKAENETPLIFPSLNVDNERKEIIKRSEELNGDLDISNSSSPRLLDHTAVPDDNKPDSNTPSLNGEDKQYEDDFSSLSDKDAQDEEDEEENEDMDEVDEDIEEDLSTGDDLLNSSASGVSDLTKDQSLSQASSVPAYQEDL